MEMEGAHASQNAQPPKVDAQPTVVEGAVSGTGLAVATAPSAEKPAAAQAPEQKTKPKENLTAAEKLKLKEEAMAALRKLSKEADRVTTAPDYVATLGVIPGQADIQSPDRFKSAFRERVRYFHPDIANRKVEQILGDVGKVFPELRDEAQKARLACEAATRKLTDAESFLNDNSRRAKYLKEKYGIQAETQDARQFKNTSEPGAQKTGPRAENTQRAERTQRGPEQSKQRTTSPDWVQDARDSYAQGFQDWRDTYASDAWQTFARTWEERKPPRDTWEKPKTVGQKVESLVERIKEAQGQRRLVEMVNIAVEAMQEVKDTMTFKHVLELILAYYAGLKEKYGLKQGVGSLPNEIAMRSIEGMLNRLKRPEDANERWMPKFAAEARLKMMTSSVSILLNYLKPKSPFGAPMRGMA